MSIIAERRHTSFFVNVTQSGIALVLILLLTYWGGIPNVQIELFGVGVAILSGLVILTVISVWWLYFSQLPPGSTVDVKATADAYHSYLLLLGGATTIIAIFWDELWHRKYGLSAILNDFLWPPHVLLYASFGLIALIAGLSIYRTIRYGKGGVRESFRSQPLVSMVGLAASFLMFSLPSDAIWHQVYGLDITAWSLPHLIIISSFTFLMLAVAASLQGQTKLSGESVLSAAALAIGSSLTMVLVSEWENASRLILLPDSDSYAMAFFSRPEWLYPVVMSGVALFIGNAAHSIVKMRGSATLAGALLVLFRLTLMGVFNGWATGMNIAAYFLLLPVMVAIDLMSPGPRPTDWKQYVLRDTIAWLAFLVAALLVIPYWIHYPAINAQTLPPMIVFSLMVCLYAGWLGRSLGERLASLQVTAVGEIKPPLWKFAVSTGAAFAAIVLMIATARTP